MTKYIRNNKGFVDIMVYVGVLAIFYIGSVLLIPHKAEEPAEKTEVSATVPSGETVSAETK